MFIYFIFVWISVYSICGSLSGSTCIPILKSDTKKIWLPGQDSCLSIYWHICWWCFYVILCKVSPEKGVIKFFWRKITLIASGCQEGYLSLSLSGPTRLLLTQKGGHLANDLCVWDGGRLRGPNYKRTHPIHSFSVHSTPILFRSPQWSQFLKPNEVLWYKSTCFSLYSF